MKQHSKRIGKRNYLKLGDIMNALLKHTTFEPHLEIKKRYNK